MERSVNNFAHILRDNDENIVTVNLTERETLTLRIYLMDTETYEELKTVSEDFKESLSYENDIFGAYDYNNVQSNSDISDKDTSDHQEPDYHDRRTRRNRGNRYADILFKLKCT